MSTHLHRINGKVCCGFFRKSALAVLFLLSFPAFSQSFQITDRSPSFASLDLDTTLEVIYSVRLTSGTTLVDVIPELVPPPGASVTVNGKTVSVIRSFYGGYVAASCTSGRSENGFCVGEVPTWSSNQVIQFRFLVHVSDSLTPGSGNSILCTDTSFANGVDFSLVFRHSTGSATITGDSNLTMGTPAAALLRLNQLYTWFDDFPTMTLLDFSFQDAPLTFGFSSFANEIQPELDKPNTRVVLAIDWKLPNDALCTGTPNCTDGFDIFVQPFDDNSNPCSIELSNAFMGNLTPFSGTVQDNTSQQLCGETTSAGSFAGSDTACDQVVYFDISDLDPACGNFNTVLSAINNVNIASTDQLSFTVAALPQDPIVIRDVRVYLGQFSTCDTAQNVFGAPSDEYAFVSLGYDNLGGITGTVDVPSSIKSNGALASGYTLDWFFDDTENYRYLGTSGSSLSFSGNFPAGISADASNPFRLIARIKHNPTGSYYPIEGRHDLTYTTPVASVRFDESETFGRTYLDPGETQRFDFNFTNQTGQTLTAQDANNNPVDIVVELTGASGHTFGTTGSLLRSGLPAEGLFNISNGQSVPVQADFFLVDLANDSFCQNLSMSTKVTYMLDGVSSSYTHTESSTANCDDRSETIDISSTNWTSSKQVVTCTNGNCTFASLPCSNCTAGNWTYEVRDSVSIPVGRPTPPGSDPGFDLTNEIYILETGALDVGFQPTLSFTHTPALPLNIAGGVLEYSPAGENNWQDLVTVLESVQGVPDIYSDLLFPDTVSSYMFNRAVWHSNFFVGGVGAQVVDPVDLPTSIFSQGSRVQFRFLFQAPFLHKADVAEIEWAITNFDFTSVNQRRDNRFGVSGRSGNSLDFASDAASVSVTLSDAGNYDFFWYTSLANLLSDTPDESDLASVNGPTAGATWNSYTPPNADATYYLKIILDNGQGSQQVRVVPLVFSTSGTGSLPWSIWRNPDNCNPNTDPNCVDFNLDGTVDVRDFVVFVDRL